MGSTFLKEKLSYKYFDIICTDDLFNSHYFSTRPLRIIVIRNQLFITLVVQIFAIKNCTC